MKFGIFLLFSTPNELKMQLSQDSRQTYQCNQLLNQRPSTIAVPTVRSESADCQISPIGNKLVRFLNQQKKLILLKEWVRYSQINLNCAKCASKVKVINLTSLQMLVIKDAHSDSMYHGNWPLLGFKIFCTT